MVMTFSIRNRKPTCSGNKDIIASIIMYLVSCKIYKGNLFNSRRNGAKHPPNLLKTAEKPPKEAQQRLRILGLSYLLFLPVLLVWLMVGYRKLRPHTPPSVCEIYSIIKFDRLIVRLNTLELLSNP